MKKQSSVNGIIIAMIGIIAVFLLSVVFGVSQYIVYKNRAVGIESKLVATLEDSKATLNNTTNKIREMAQVPEMYKNDLYGLVEKTFAGRYGQDGSKAVFQFIQENNLNLDAQLYRNIQAVIESGRNEFLMTQKVMIDVKRTYVTQLEYVYSGFWMGVAGYPRVDLDKFKPLASEEVDTKFETGKDEAIKLR